MFNEYTSEIIINHKVLISDILTKEEKKRTDFIKGILNMSDITHRKTYEVFICKLDENTALLKPIKPYYCYNFEYLFNFGFQCEEFDPNKIIKIKMNS